MPRLGSGRNHLLPNVTEEQNYGSCAQVATWIPQTFSDCNIHGTIAFQEVTGKSLANFIQLKSSDVEGEGKLDAVYELMANIWKVPSPNLIVSVTGGAKNFDIDTEVLKNFKDIIHKISQTPGAWVVTGGTHTGVMKHVGDVMREESTAVCVGIPTWGIVKDRNKLIPGGPFHSGMFPYHVGAWLKAEGAYLDPNHNQFILFDDGTEGKYGGEIKFRADLEDYIVKKNNIPYVLIVLNGGPGTFVTVCETIARGHKVILVKESGGVADLVSHLIEGDESYLETQKSLIQKLKDTLEDRFDAEWETCKNKKDSFVIAQKEGERSINDVVTRAILTTDQEEGAEIPTINYLRLAISWHNPEILTKLIPINKPEKFISDSSDDMPERICFKDLERILIRAFATGDLTFVKLLMLDYEVDIQDILTMDVLRLLYGYQSHEKNFPKTFAGLTENDYVDLSGPDVKKTKCYQEVYYWNSNMNFGDGNRCILTREAVCKLRQKFMKKIKDPCSGRGCSSLGPSCGDRKWFCCEDSGDEGSVVMCDPLWELFIWSCVSNLPHLAKFVWTFEGNQLAKSLIACHFWGKQVKRENLYSEQELESFRESEEAFGSLAYALLNECYKADEEKAISLITTTLEEVPNSSCLDIALEFNNHDFVAHSCVQNILTDVWTGQMELKEVTTATDYLWLLLAIVLPCFIVKWFKFKRGENRGKSEETMFEKANNIKHFYSTTPAVRFLLHFVFYILFLILYSAVILDERMHEPRCNSRSLRNSTETKSTNSRGIDICTSTMEIVVYIIVLGHLTTELYQITQYAEGTAIMKLKSWIGDIYCYNLWDILNLLLFIIAVGLRFNDATRHVGHTLRAVNCMFWIIRLTTSLQVHPQFGQYYEMVHLMLADLINFVILFGFMVLAYGVFFTAVLYPESALKQPFISIVMKPWFHIYGEFFLEGEPGQTPFGTVKYNGYDEYFVWIFMGFYLGITNIVLLNIIIAVFNNTYEEVKNQGRKIWKFNRYHLMLEYTQRVTLPPPFCIIQHTYFFIRWVFLCCFKSNCSSFKEKEVPYSHFKRDKSNLSEEDKIKLSQYECDRALYIRNNNMEFVDGTVIIKWLENDKHACTVTGEGLEKNMKKIRKEIENSAEGLGQNIKEIKSKMENSTDVKSDGLEKNMKEILENMQKMMSKIENLEKSVAEINETKLIT